MTKPVLLSLRVTTERAEQYAAAAEESGLSRSEWMRFVLDAAALGRRSASKTPVEPVSSGRRQTRAVSEPVRGGGYPAPRVRPSEIVVPAGAEVAGAGGCEHPKSKRRQLGYATICGVCNGIVDGKPKGARNG